MNKNESTNFDQYQTDVLFLLIGSNPLPNYVAASILTREHSIIILLHSSATSEVAERLARRLISDQPGLTVQLYGISEADGPAIARKVSDVAQPFARTSPRVSVGLNYTGGTKPMAAYSYHALVQMFSSNVFFSYLDARTLSMIIDPGVGPVQQEAVARSIRLTLDDIAELHGYEIRKKVRRPRNELLARAISEVHLAPDGMEQWRTWLNSWRDRIGLPSLTEYPELAPALAAFDEVGGGEATEEGVAQALSFQQLRQCGKYLIGGWLEDYSLEALATVAQEAELDDYAMGVLVTAAHRSEFELDLAATIGYQLFAISCIVTKKKSKAKEHLFEVVTRANQLGGDEARFAAVTFCDDRNVRKLEQEVSQEWDAVGANRQNIV